MEKDYKVATMSDANPNNMKVSEQPNGYADGKARPGEYNKKFVYLLASFATIGGLLFGYDTGIVSGAMLLVTPYFDLSTTWTEGIVSGTIGAAAVFAIIAGFCTDYLGRKKTIMIASIVFTIGAVIMAAAPSKEVLLAGRIVVGMGIGFASMTVPVYVAESSPTEIRGRLVTLNQLFITIGILISSVVAGAFSTNKDKGWRYMLGLAGVPSLIQFFGFIVLPESPRWLVSKGRDEEAMGVLQKIRGYSNVQGELQEIKDSIEEDKKYQSGFALSKVCGTRHVLKALVIGSGLQLFQQFCGINTVIYYSASIIKLAGFPSKYAIWLVVVPNAVNFMATFIGLWLVERMGRKLLTVISFGGVVVALVVLAVGFQLSSIHSPAVTNGTEFYANGTIIEDECTLITVCETCADNKGCGFCWDDIATATCLPTGEKKKEEFAAGGRCNETNMNVPGTQINWAYDYCPTDYTWMAVLGLALFVLAFAPGLGPMPWTINSEIFPMWARSTCIAITTMVNWVCNLIVSFTFLTLTETITKHGTFWLFCGICFLGMLFTIVTVPETKNKTLEEVEMLFMTPEKRKQRSEERMRQHNGEVVVDEPVVNTRF